METFMMEFLMIILKCAGLFIIIWAGLLTIILIGLGVLLAIAITLSLIRLLCYHLKPMRESSENSEEYMEDDYDH